jgi:hypothetical protein
MTHKHSPNQTQWSQWRSWQGNDQGTSDSPASKILTHLQWTIHDGKECKWWRWAQHHVSSMHSPMKELPESRMLPIMWWTTQKGWMQPMSQMWDPLANQQQQHKVTSRTSKRESSKQTSICKQQTRGSLTCKETKDWSEWEWWKYKSNDSQQDGSCSHIHKHANDSSWEETHCNAAMEKDLLWD